MATDPADVSLSTEAAQKLAPAPLSGTRGQAIQRLQVGLFGIATMVLLVGLANIIKTNAAQNEARVVPEAAPTVAGDEPEATVRDPQADAAVVPDMPDEPQDQPGNAPPALQP